MDEEHTHRVTDHDHSPAVQRAPAIGAEIAPGQGILLLQTPILSSLPPPGRGNAPVRASMLQRMQQTHGNRAVQRFLRLQRSPASAPPAQDDDIARRIDSRSGGGASLDTGAQRTLEQGLGADLSGVRVHTDGEADHLARSVDSVAFTTGSDIFFRQGAYNPSTPGGMHLLAHEVTHTVQQASGPVAGTPSTGGVSISDPSDQFEQAAEQTAANIVSGNPAPVQASGRSSPSAPIQREAKPEEDGDELHAQTMRTSVYVQREASREEDEDQKPMQAMSASVAAQREVRPEEEDEQAKPAQAMRESAASITLQREVDPNYAGSALSKLHNRGPRVVQRSLTGSHPVTQGSFEMSMIASTGTVVRGTKHYGLFGDIKFQPSEKAPYSNKIGLIQIAKSSTPAGATIRPPASLPADTEPNVRTADDKAKGIEGGFATDVYHLPLAKKGQALAPYYAFTPTFGFKRSDDPGDIKAAGLWDSPGTGNAPGDVDFSFETVAKGDDNMLTYGSVKWAFGLRSKGTPIINETMTVTDAQSATFDAALEKHRDFYVHEPVTFYFDFNRDNLPGTESGKIDTFLDYLRRFPDVHLTLTGYADKKGGSGSFNEDLAGKRADSVRKALIAKGIAAGRINDLLVASGGATTEFTDDADPSRSQDLEANRRGNRRVMLTFAHTPAAGGAGGAGGTP